jgi:hypothetical protein
MTYGLHDIPWWLTSTGQLSSGRGWTGSKTDARAGDERARTVLVFVARALDQLRNLPEPPRRESETATLR